jgi:hypothetical protein
MKQERKKILLAFRAEAQEAELWHNNRKKLDSSR